MLRFKYIMMRNFLSFGNLPQRVELNSSPLTLIMGTNNDATSDENGDETRNGVGKSTIMQALNFVLYGKSIDNRIKLTNLVNKTNKKNCEVEVEFEKDGAYYKIIRTRSPTNVHLYVNDTMIIDPENSNVEDEAQGENRATQQVIEEIIGMSQEMFTQIVTLSTSDEPFLAKGAAKQRQLIEELLTITQLSEKAEKLKELVKGTKEAIEREKFRCDTIEASNAKILETIKGFEQQSSQWEQTKSKNLEDVNVKLDTYPAIEVDACLFEIDEAAKIIDHNIKSKQLRIKFDETVKQAYEFEGTKEDNVAKIITEIEALKQFDINAEIEAHAELELWKEEKATYDSQMAEIRLLTSSMEINRSKINKCIDTVNRIEKQIESTRGAVCPTCNSELDHEKHMEIVEALRLNMEEENEAQVRYAYELEEITKTVNEMSSKLIPVQAQPVTHYKTVAEAYQHQANIVALESKLEQEQNKENTRLTEALALQAEVDAHGHEFEVPSTRFKTSAEVYQYENTRNKLVQQRDHFTASQNPYISQINTLRESSLQNIEYDELNRLRKMQEHQEFLVKLLTNKNSFVRKRIIDQNLSFLNNRLAHYIAKSGSPHVVTFLNDLSVDITHMGNNYDFDNLSRGEKTRVVIALTLAFRDTFESLNFAVNTLMIDELLDNGLDAAGVNDCYKMLVDIGEKSDKNVFLITHRQELQQKANNIMMIVKENGFSSVEQNDAEAL